MTATKKTTRRAAAKATKKARRPTAPSKAGRPRGPLKYQAILDEALKLKPDTYLAVAVPKGYTPQEYRNVLNVALRDRLEPCAPPDATPRSGWRLRGAWGTVSGPPTSTSTGIAASTPSAVATPARSRRCRRSSAGRVRSSRIS